MRDEICLSWLYFTDGCVVERADADGPRLSNRERHHNVISPVGIFPEVSRGITRL